MSLPTAPKDISDNPKTGSVTSPVNQAQKDADVERKLKFYGVIQAFRAGNLPSNAQIDAALSFAKNHSPVDVNQLSPAGKRLVEDVRDVIETARVIVAEKNKDELVQGFVWDTRNTTWDQHRVGSDDVPLTKDQASSDGQQALQHLRTLLHLLLTNSEARKLITDSSIIGRDLLSLAASKAARTIAPTDEQLRAVDQSAPNDHFVTNDKGEHTLSATVPGTGHVVESHPEHGVRVHTEGGETKGLGQVRDEVTDRLPAGGDMSLRNQAQAAYNDPATRGQAQDLASQGQDVARGHRDDIQGQVDAAPEDQKADAAKGGLKSKILGFRDNMLDRIPQEHKDRAGDQFDRSKTFLTEEYFPKERRDQFVYRGKKVIMECQKHPEYQQSLTWLLDALEQYATHGKTLAQTTHAKTTSPNPTLDSALAQFRTILERFANNQSFQPILDAITQLGEDAKNDEELRGWLRQVDEYVRKVLLDAGYVLEPASDTRADELRESGRVFWDGRYKTHFDAVFERFGGFFGAMGDDPLNKRFGQDWARLSRDILFDAEGKLVFKPELWGDIRKVILPSLIERVGYVPIPRIEYTDDGLDLVVENLTLSGPNLFPNIVTMEAHNFIKFSPYASVKDESHHDLTLTFSHIQADLRDVAFYFRRKQGFGKLTDSGLADILLGGTGLTVTTHLRSAPESDTSSVFIVKDVNVVLGDVKVAIRDSKHDLLYKTLKPLIMGLVKKQIKKAVEDGVRTGLEYVDGQLVGVRDRMREAKVDSEGSRVQVLQDMFKKKTDEVTSVKSKTDKHFKVGSQRNSVLMPDQGHPAGWVNRISEKQEDANKGEGWKSPAFEIVGGGVGGVNNGHAATSPTSPTTTTAASATGKSNTAATTKA